MKIRCQHHRHRQPDRYQLKKRASGIPGDAESKRSVGGVRKDQQGQPDKTPFFPNVPGDEIVIAERQESVLLPPASKPDTEYLPRPDRDQRLPELVADLQRRSSRVEERGQAYTSGISITPSATK